MKPRTEGFGKPLSKEEWNRLSKDEQMELLGRTFDYPLNREPGMKRRKPNGPNGRSIKKR